MTLHDLFTQYKLRNLRAASPGTIKLWKISLRHFDRFLGRPATADDLTDETVLSFGEWRMQHVAAATVNKDLASLLALWRWSHRTGRVTRWPDVPLYPEPERIPKAWTRGEFSRLIAAARSLDGYVGRVPARSWWTSLLLVLFDSGERIRATLSLRWQNVDLDGRWVQFAAETRKGKRSDSIVRIAEDTAAALLEVKPHSDGLVWPWPHADTHIYRHLDGILRAAGLPVDRQRKFHCVRRTTASHLEANGGNATEALRHSSRRTTLSYLDPRIATPPQPVDLLWRPG